MTKVVIGRQKVNFVVTDKQKVNHLSKTQLVNLFMPSKV